MKRRQGVPADSYENKDKDLYRRQVWNALEELRCLSSVPMRDRRVLLLDEWMAWETRFLVRRGYSPENIVAATRRVAVAARISGSLHAVGIEGVKATSGDVADIYARYAEQGRKFDAIHLDFCGNISEGITETIEAFNGCASLGPTAIAINLLRGRESNPIYRSAVDSILRCGGTTDDARLAVTVAALCAVQWEDDELCRQHLLDAVSRSYVSTTGQSMLWLAGELRVHGTALLDERHVHSIWRIARQRTSPTIHPDGFWSVPHCVKCLSAGGRLSIEQVLEPLVASAEAGTHLRIRLSNDQRQMYKEVLDRKLSDPRFGPALNALKVRHAAELHRQNPYRDQP
jgi:hypothetical protein